MLAGTFHPLMRHSHVVFASTLIPNRQERLFFFDTPSFSITCIRSVLIMQLLWGMIFLSNIWMDADTMLEVGFVVAVTSALSLSTFLMIPGLIELCVIVNHVIYPFESADNVTVHRSK